MKKILSIIIAISVIACTCFCLPIQTASAEDVVSINFTDGVTWKLSDGTTMDGASWGSATGSNGSVTISNSNFPYRSAFAKITGFVPGKTYNLSFTIPTSGIEHATIVLDDTAYFKNHILYGENGQTRINSSNCSTFSAGTASTSFTAINDYIYLAIKVGNISKASFSNFVLSEVPEEIVLGNTLANKGNWAVTQGASGVVTKSNGTVKITGAQYQKISVAVENLKVNTDYTISFNHSAGNNYLFANPAYVVPGESVYSSGVLNKAGTIKFSNGECNTATTTTIKFTTNSVDTTYLLVFECSKPDGATSFTVTLNNFSVKIGKTHNDWEIAGNKIADGSWFTTGGTVKNNLSLHTVKVNAANNSVYTTFTGLKNNTKYELTCNFDIEGLTDVYIVNSTLTAPEFNNGDYIGNCSDIVQKVNAENGALNISFITDVVDSEYTLIFSYDENATTITYSDFVLKNLGEFNNYDITEEFKNGDWRYSAGSIATNSDGSITAKTPNHFVYAKLPVLPNNSLVKIEADYSKTGNIIESLYIVSASEDFIVDETTGAYSGSQNNLATYSIENGNITAYFRTTDDRAGYYFALKHGKLLGEGITYNNFKIEVIDGVSDTVSAIKGNNLLDSMDWELQHTNNGKITHDNVNHTLTQSGNSYQDISAVMEGLDTNAAYKISVKYTANDIINKAYVYPAEAGKWKPSSNIATVLNDTENCVITISFNTDSKNTDYYLHFSHSVLANNDITYSSMKIAAEKIIFNDEIDGSKIADAQWYGQYPDNVRFSHNYINHSFTQSQNSYQKIYTRLNALNPSTEYEFTADYTLDDVIEGVYFVPAGQELNFDDISQYSLNYTLSNNKIKFSFVTSVVDTEYYLILAHGKLTDDTITYSNLKLKAIKTWVNEEQGALLTQNEWATTSSNGSVTTDIEKASVTTNVTGGYIYTKLSGLKLNTTYRITCGFTGNDSDISAVYIGSGATFPFGGFLDRLYNKASATSIKNNRISITFKTTSDSNYWLAIKLGNRLNTGSVTFSDFSLAIAGVTTVNDAFSDWKSPNTSASITVEESTVTATAKSGSIYTKIDGLNLNTSYSLSFTHSSLSSVSKVIIIPAEESLSRSKYWSGYYYNGKYVNNSYGTTALNMSNNTTNIVFSTNEEYSGYYLIIEFKTESNETANFSGWELKEFEELRFVGTAIRKSGAGIRQALRYKTTISGAALKNGCFGLDIKEYGSIAARTNELQNNPLVINESGVVGLASVKRGVAYNATTNKIFETLDDGGVVFTAALTGIATENYANDYTVRPYVILTDGQNDYTIYGTEQDYSVFKVFDLIEDEGTKEDRLTVYDILDNKPNINTAFLTFKGLDANNPDSLLIYNNTVISDNYKGLSGTVYHSSGYITNDVTGRNYTDEQRQTELKRLSESGVKYCRTRFSPRTIWNNGKFNFSAVRMQNFINYCKALESKGISVCLQTSWYLNEILENNKDTSADSYLNGNGVDLYYEQTNYISYIANEYKLSGSEKMPTGETVTDYYNRIGVAAVRYGVYLSNFIKAAKDSGVNNIDYLIYFTEPSYATDDKPEGEYANEYLFICKTIRNVIEATGNAANVKHVGPNQGSVTDGLGLLKYVVTREPDLFDVLTAHFYPNSESIYDDKYYEQCTETFKSYLDVLKDAGVENKEFWVDEFFAIQNNGSRVARQSAMAALQTIVGAISAQQLGVENIVLWQMFDQAWGDSLENGGEFENGIHICGTCPSLLISDIPYAAYYPLSLFMRFNSATNGKSYKAISGVDGVYIGAMQNDNGGWTITVVNVSSSEKLISLNFESAINQTLYRYSVSSKNIKPTADAVPTEYGRVFKNVSNALTDTVAAYSVSIYTTSAN